MKKATSLLPEAALLTAACRMGVPFLLVLPFVIGRGRGLGMPGHRGGHEHPRTVDARPE